VNIGLFFDFCEASYNLKSFIDYCLPTKIILKIKANSRLLLNNLSIIKFPTHLKSRESEPFLDAKPGHPKSQIFAASHQILKPKLLVFSLALK